VSALLGRFQEVGRRWPNPIPPMPENDPPCHDKVCSVAGPSHCFRHRTEDGCDLVTSVELRNANRVAKRLIVILGRNVGIRVWGVYAFNR
jgi:hypothetical protein